MALSARIQQEEIHLQLWVWFDGKLQKWQKKELKLFLLGQRNRSPTIWAVCIHTSMCREESEHKAQQQQEHQAADFVGAKLNWFILSRRIS